MRRAQHTAHSQGLCGLQRGFTRPVPDWEQAASRPPARAELLFSASAWLRELLPHHCACRAMPGRPAGDGAPDAAACTCPSPAPEALCVQEALPRRRFREEPPERGPPRHAARERFPGREGYQDLDRPRGRPFDDRQPHARCAVALRLGCTQAGRLWHACGSESSTCLLRKPRVGLHCMCSRLQ